MKFSLKSDSPAISVVIPCLNEEDTIGRCLQKLVKVVVSENIQMEVIVADNGSTDKSVEICEGFGVVVLEVKQRGYGSALKRGIEVAKAEYVLMADADDSYDFFELPTFYHEIKKDYDLAQGCRFPKGGGNILKGAMPWSHRYFGNPFFTYLVRSWFKSPVNDVYCGMRAFKKSFYSTLKMRSNGMEFATEMIIKAALVNAKTSEVPITLHKDGRIQHPPHLRTFRDGWKTLQFFFLCAPAKLFLFPGIIMIIFGLLGNIGGYFNAYAFGISLGAHTMLGASLFIICGHQAVLMHYLSVQASSILSINTKSKKKIVVANVKTTLVWIIFLLIGIGLWFKVFFNWYSVGFGELDYGTSMKLVIPGATLIFLSMQTLFFTFFKACLKLRNF